MFILKWINKWRLTEEINDIRHRNGLKPLSRMRFLDKIAWQHARYMARNDKLGHDGFHSRSLLIREQKKTIPSKYVGENCGKCPGRSFNKEVIRATTDGWMKSASHRKAILNPEYNMTGVGCISNKEYVYIVQIFVG